MCCTPGNSGVNSSETKYINKYRIHLLMLLIFKLQNLRTMSFFKISLKRHPEWKEFEYMHDKIAIPCKSLQPS